MTHARDIWGYPWEPPKPDCPNNCAARRHRDLCRLCLGDRFMAEKIAAMPREDRPGPDQPMMTPGPSEPAPPRARDETTVAAEIFQSGNCCGG